MKKTLLIGIAIIALFVGGVFAVPRLELRAKAATPAVAKAKAVNAVTAINIIADHLTAARLAATVREVAFSPPDKGETLTAAQPTAINTSSREIAFIGAYDDRLDTGPPLIANELIDEQLTTSRRGLDTPGWIDSGGGGATGVIRRE
jgi:hypothetical protein